jgi:uncharacterized protein YbjT (DUF2867 family)
MRFALHTIVAAFFATILSGESEGMSRSPEVQDKILVMGATGDTGFKTVEILKADGVDVVAFARETSDRARLDELSVEVAIGDAFDKSTIDPVLSSGNFTAIVSALGGRFGDPRRVDFEGNKNLIDAAKEAGVDRYILVTMIGVGDSAQAIPDNVKQFFSKVIELKTQAEDYLKASGLNYTILRPGGLLSELATGNGMRTQDPTVMGTIHRPDLAQLIVDALNDNSQIGEIYSVVDANMLGVPDNEFIRTGIPPGERER